MKGLYCVAAAAVLVVAASIACGSSNAGVQVGTSAPNPTTAPPKVQIYRAGDVIQVQNHTIVLNDAQISNGVLQANFTVENKGTGDLAVSSMMSFEAKNSDGSKLEQDIFDCPSGNLDGSVLPGDKLKGNVCWKGAVTDTVKIYYSASLLGSGAVVWEISK